MATNERLHATYCSMAHTAKAPDIMNTRVCDSKGVRIMMATCYSCIVIYTPVNRKHRNSTWCVHMRNVYGGREGGRKRRKLEWEGEEGKEEHEKG